MVFHALRELGERSRAARMIREHSHWLTRALRSGRRYPRIPTRRVSDGGFAFLSRLPGGRRMADRWWQATLEKLD